MKNLLAIVLTTFFISGSSNAQETAPADPAQCGKALQSVATTSYVAPQAIDEFTKASCADHNIICIGPNGQPLPNEESNVELRPGSTATVKLFGPAACGKVLSVSADITQTAATLFPPPTNDNLRDALAPGLTQAETKIEVLASTAVTPDSYSESVTFFVVRTDTGNRLPGLKVDVTQPRYYLDVGVLVAFTPYFKEVSAARVPGQQDSFIRETNTIHPSAAIGVNYYPFGQYTQPRFTGYHGLAIQAAIGANLSRIDDEFYLGLLWEPVPGAGISAGLAMLQMQRLQPNYPSGALVQPNDIPKDTYLGGRAYFGVSLNTRVFRTLLDIGGKVNVPHN